MNYILITKVFLILICSFYSEVLSKDNLVLECKITQELENNVNSKKKMYKDNKIKIYIDKLNSWISDISFDNWLSENDIDKIERRLIDKKKQYLFKFLEFQSKKKEILYLSHKIVYEKFGGYFEFKKYYHDHDGNSFFISEVRGNCIEESKFFLKLVIVE